MNADTRQLKRLFRRIRADSGGCFRQWARAVADATERSIVGPPEAIGWAQGWLARKGLR